MTSDLCVVGEMMTYDLCVSRDDLTTGGSDGPRIRPDWFQTGSNRRNMGRIFLFVCEPIKDLNNRLEFLDF